MVIDLANCKLKMVVIIATALALGIGAVTACVVPWLCYNPTDSTDDDRDATPTRDNTGSDPRLNSKHDNKPTATQVRINGFSFVQVVHIPGEPSVNHEYEKSTSGQSEVTDRATQIRSLNPETSHFSSIAEGTNNSENPSRATDESSDLRASEVIANVQICHQSRKKFVSFNDPSLMIKTEENLTDPTESSIPTDESSTETTVRASSGTSGLDNSTITDQTDERSAESTSSSDKSVKSKIASKRGSRLESSDRKSTKSTFSEPGSLDRIDEDTSTSPKIVDPPNSSRDDSVETTIESSTCRESANSSGTSKLEVHAIIESAKGIEVRETIPEVSSRSVTPRNVSPNFNESSNRSMTSTISASSTNSRQSTFYSHPCDNAKKKSLFPKSLPRRIVRFFQGRKADGTPRSSREELRQPLHIDSVQSLLAGKKVPAGNSTRISEDQRPLDAIRGSRSMSSMNDLSIQFQDPRIFCARPNETDFASQIDKGPLDLSIRSMTCGKKP